MSAFWLDLIEFSKIADMSKPAYNRIKIALVEANRTGKELAKKLGKTETTVSRWCTNDMQPPIEVFYEIAKYLNVELHDLLVPVRRIADSKK